MKISTFGFLTRRGVRNLGKHWAMTIACIASLSVCMTLNIFASLIEVNVDSMVSYLGSQNEMVVYVDPEADDATIQSVGNALSGTAGVSRVQYMSKEDVLNQYKGYMSDYAALLNEFENDNPFKANYRVSLSDLNQMETISKQFENISGVYSVTAPIEMTKTFVEIQQAVTKVGRGLVLVLMAVSIITVGTTIRLSVFARRREIEIMKYVGATNALVTLPFVIEGLTMGLLSGILTVLLTTLALALLDPMLAWINVTPESGEVYFSFIKSGGYVPIPEGYEIAGITALDGVFNKIDGMPPNEVPRWGSKRPPLIKVEGGKIIPADFGVINQPYVVKFKKTEG